MKVSILSIRIFIILVILASSQTFSQTTPAVLDTTLANDYYLKAVNLAKETQYDSSIYYFEKALDIRRLVLDENDQALAENYMKLGMVHLSAQHYEEALQYFEKASMIFLKAGGRTDSVNLANSYRSLGRVYKRLNKYDEALQFHEKALNLKLDLFGENHESIVREYGSIGIVHRRKGDHVRALEYFERALSIGQTILSVNHLDLSNLYNNIGNVYSDQQNYEKAIEYYKEAINKDLSGPAPRHALIAARHHNIGNNYWLMRDLENALKYLKKGLAGFRKEVSENHPWTAMSYTVQSWVYSEMGDLEKAIEMITKSLNIRLNLFGKYHEGTAQSYLGLAEAYDKRGDFRRALKWSQEALIALCPGFVDTSTYVNPRVEKTISEVMLFYALKWKAEIFGHRYERGSHDIKDLQMSMLTYERESELLDQMRVGHKSEGSKLSWGQAVLQIHGKAIQTAIELYKVTGDEKYKQKAFVYSAKSKAAVLSSALQESRARDFGGISEILLEQVENLQTYISDYKATLQKEKLRKEDADTLKIQESKAKVFALKLEYDALLQNLERDYPDYYDLKYQTRVASLEDLQKFLDEETAMIEYFVGDSTMFIFLITKNDIEVKSVAKDSSFTSMVSEVHKSIKKLDADKFIQTSRELYLELMGPIESEIVSMKKLIIIPDGILLKVPFEALLTQRPTPAGQVDFTKLSYMVNKFEISYHYSATLFLNSVNRGNYLATKVRPQSRGDFLGFAPVFSDQPQPGYELASKYPIESFEFSDKETRAAIIDGQHFSELKYSKTEVESLIKVFEKDGRAGVAFFYGDASEENFKKQARNYRFIHVATHGLINENEPGLSGIVFSQPTDSTFVEDGILYAGETYNLGLNTDLLVLSSCESGIGKLVRGEGLMALTRGFLYSGARNIIVSLWKVSDKHTSQLMIELYKNILSGKSYSKSLREAKLKMLRNPATAFPKSWSSFVLIGR